MERYLATLKTGYVGEEHQILLKVKTDKRHLISYLQDLAEDNFDMFHNREEVELETGVECEISFSYEKITEEEFEELAQDNYEIHELD